MRLFLIWVTLIAGLVAAPTSAATGNWTAFLLAVALVGSNVSRLTEQPR